MAAAVVLAVVAAPGPASAQSPASPLPPHLAKVVAAIEASEQGYPSLEGKAWQVTEGNQLAGPGDDWLLQMPDCWGDTTGCGPANDLGLPPGGKRLLAALTAEIARATTLVDVTSLLPFPDDKANGAGFESAIAAGLAKAYVAGAGATPPHDPLARFLFGAFPDSDPSGDAPTTFLQSLVAEITKDEDGATAAPLRIAVGDYRSSNLPELLSWNHSKIVAVDGETAIVGGVNSYSNDYLQQKNPVTDTDLEVSGPAALAATDFADQLWGFACTNAGSGTNVSLAYQDVSTCPASEADTVPTPARPGDETVLALGRLGYGVAPWPSGKDATPSGVTQTDLDNADCSFGVNDYTNNSTKYDAANPGEVGLRALIASATTSVVISQQDLLQDPAESYCVDMAQYDVRLFQILADKIVKDVPVTIVVSNPGAMVGQSSYANGSPVLDIAADVRFYVQQQPGMTKKAATAMVCSRLHLAPLRTSDNAGWPGEQGDQAEPSLHTKVVLVDDQAFYIGSENLYPAYLQEFGYVVEDPAAARTLDDQLLEPEWQHSEAAAVTGGTRRCQLTTATPDPAQARRRPGAAR